MLRGNEAAHNFQKYCSTRTSVFRMFSIRNILGAEDEQVFTLAAVSPKSR